MSVIIATINLFKKSFVLFTGDAEGMMKMIQNIFGSKGKNVVYLGISNKQKQQQ